MAIKDDVIYPLFADGHLKGKEYEVRVSHLGIGVETLEGTVHYSLLDIDAPLPIVRYKFYQLGLLGQIIWVGATKAPEYLTVEEQVDLFKQIVSIRAIRAMKGPPCV